MKKYILALDEGTTSARAILFDRNGVPVSWAQREFEQIFPCPGYVEHDPLEIYSAQYSAMTEAVNRIDAHPSEICAVGITNQRETAVVWEKETGRPVCNAIVWQCRRTAEICEDLKAGGFEDYIRKTTGLKIDPYFSASKIKWILDTLPGARSAAERGELLCGTVDTWLIWKLSEGRLHITDYTNACRTLLFDIHNLCWDRKLLDIFGIPESMLPKAVPSSQIYGKINLLGEDIPVAGIAGDQQAALFGQGCFNAGDIKNTYGTGCFLLMNTGERAIESKNGLLCTVCAGAAGEPVSYALEGSVFVGGAVIQWLRDEIELLTTAAESEKYALSVEDNGGVYIVPAFVGLGAPYWDMYARGTITGLTRGSRKSHIIRAALESIAYQTNDLLEAMKDDSGIPINFLKADGGAARNNFLMQFQSDISDTIILRPEMSEATALGAAFLAGLAIGFWKDKHELLSLGSQPDKFSPNLSRDKRSALISGWNRAVKATVSKE